MVNHSLLYIGLVTLLGAFVAGVLRATWLRIGAFVMVSLALVGSNWGSPADLGKQWLGQIILLAVIVCGVRWVMRFNIFGGFLVIGILALVEQAAELLGQADGFYRWNGYVVVAALVGLLVWPIVMWRTSRGSVTGSTAAAS